MISQILRRAAPCRPWHRLAIAALAATLVLHASLAPAIAQVTGRYAVLVIDANTGRILHQQNADALRYPASLTKLMSLYLIFELIEAGRLAYATKIRFSANAASAPPSRLDVAEGDEIELIDAIKALITKSANDVAIAVAEHIGGSEERFAQMMTAKARQLGMTHTTFKNASGLPDSGQVTTAHDMITLALRLQDDFPRHYPLFATRTFTWGDDTYRNHNRLLFSYKGTDGMKTGYIRASGFNLVASVRRGKKHVVAALFGGKTAGRRNRAMRRHLDKALRTASAKKTRQPAALLVAAAEPAPAETAAIGKGHTAPRPPAAAVAKAAALPGSGSTVIAKTAAVAGEGGSAGSFHIQIGAFRSEDEAKRLLASVRGRAGAVLGAHTALTPAVEQGGKVLYRARYGGFDAQAAAAACGALKRLDIDCLVIRAE